MLYFFIIAPSEVEYLAESGNSDVHALGKGARQTSTEQESSKEAEFFHESVNLAAVSLLLFYNNYIWGFILRIGCIVG